MEFEGYMSSPELQLEKMVSSGSRLEILALLAVHTRVGAVVGGIIWLRKTTVT